MSRVLFFMMFSLVVGCAANGGSSSSVPQRDYAKCYTESQCAEAIGAAIRLNWSRPDSARNGLIVMIELSLAYDGSIDSLDVKQYSGNVEYDFSTINAIRNSAPFSELSNLDALIFNRFFKKFKVRFRPEDLAN